MDQITIARSRLRIAPVVALVVALHATLLTTSVRSARSQGDAPVGGQMLMRVLPAAPVQAVAGRAEAALSSAPQAPLPTVLPDSVAAMAAPPNQPGITVESAGVPASPSPPAPRFGLVLPGVDNDADYFPRSMLSQAPSPLEPVVIDYPSIENDSGHHISELTLFIDETGRVARLRVDGAALHPALEAAALKAFTGALFRAGEVEGRAVKSRIRIEVVFDQRSVNRQ